MHLDGHLRRAGHLEHARRPVAVERELGVREVAHQQQPVPAREFDAPGEEREVALVPLGGWHVVFGMNGLVNGPLDGEGAREAALDRAREQGFDKPLAWDGRYPSLGLRRAVQYGKGALFLADLRETVGDAAFWRGLRRYTRRHAGGTVTSRDLQHAMERASGRDLSPLFAEWVYGR